MFSISDNTEKSKSILGMSKLQRACPCLFIEFIEERFRKSISLVWTDKNGGALIDTPSMGTDAITGYAYGFLCSLWSGAVEVRRCAYCSNIFTPTPRGRGQKYCTHACKMKEYRRRKNTLLTTQSA